VAGAVSSEEAAVVALLLAGPRLKPRTVKSEFKTEHGIEVALLVRIGTRRIFHGA
jgi:hypothetical protein